MLDCAMLWIKVLYFIENLYKGFLFHKGKKSYILGYATVRALVRFFTAATGAVCCIFRAVSVSGNKGSPWIDQICWSSFIQFSSLANYHSVLTVACVSNHFPSAFPNAEMLFRSWFLIPAVINCVNSNRWISDTSSVYFSLRSDSSSCKFWTTTTFVFCSEVAGAILFHAQPNHSPEASH